MIGVDQEPSRKVLDALNEALGEGNYTIAYHDGPHGVAGIIRLREAPQREFKTQFARDAVPEQVEAVWQELIARTTATLNAEREQEQAAARGYRPEANPANEVKPGEAVPVTSIEYAEGEGARLDDKYNGTTLANDVTDALPEERSSNDPVNAPGVDHAHVESGTGSSEHAGSGGGDAFESSTADERSRR